MESQSILSSPSAGFGRAALLSGALLALAYPNLAVATHIPTSHDVNLKRPMMPFEGYLKFDHSAAVFTPGGGAEELTGWTDIRNPAFYNGADRRSTTITNTTNPRGIGYDRSDFQVRVQNVIATDKNGAPAHPNKDSIEGDFNYANQIYRQLGISVLSTGNVDAAYNNVTFPVDINSFAEVNKLWGANRPGGNTVPNYYVSAFTPAASGVGAGRNLPGVANNNGGTAIADAHNPDSFAHEVGHFLLDNNRFNHPDNGNTDNLHSPVVTDLMRTGTPGRTIPNNDVKRAADPQGRVNTAPSQPGQRVGNIGGLDQFTALVGPAGGPFMTPQIDAIFGSQSNGTAFVQRQDNGRTFGDRADFDWVEDNKPLESAKRANVENLADNHDGVDFMVWEIGAIAPSGHPNPMHDHGDWGELALNRFMGPFFRTIDIVSQIARYADMDVMGGAWSPRESALDFRGCAMNIPVCNNNDSLFPEFSIDGMTWFPGALINVFTPGWNDTKSLADDFVSRWRSPIDATLVRLQAFALGGDHDGNTQIDAIIATREIVRRVPEPGSLALLLLGGAGVFGARCVRRRKPA